MAQAPKQSEATFETENMQACWGTMRSFCKQWHPYDAPLSHETAQHPHKKRLYSRVNVLKEPATQ